MRVAQMIDELRLVGGAERLQRTFAEAVRSRDVELTVVTLHAGDLEAEREIEALGARVVRFPARRFASIARARALRRFLAEERFDVLHTHLVRSTILGAAAARTVDLPVVATLHNTQRNGRLPALLDRAEGLVLRRWTDCVIAVGWETARAHEERLRGRPLEVVPNAVPCFAALGRSERDKARRELGVAESTPLLVTVGRLHPQKALPVLLHALADLRDQGIDFALRVAGVGSREEEIREQIRRLRLGDRVGLLGLRRDIPRILGASDVYVSSSTWEGLPVATLEAMAAGLPIVATAVGDVPHVVTSEVGTLVEPGAVGALGRALAHAIHHPELRAQQGAAGRRRARTCFGQDAWISRHLELYQGLARRATGEERR